MPVSSSSYKPFIQGVSQQVAQSRADGQLTEQINMLSDIVTGLRRRTGIRFIANLEGMTGDAFVKVVQLSGDVYVLTVEPSTGVLSLYTTSGLRVYTVTNEYYKANSRLAYRTTVARDYLFILNTDKVPTAKDTPTTRLNPDLYGYVNIRAGAFSKSYTTQVRYGTYTGSFTANTDASSAASASPSWVAATLVNSMNADATFKAFATAYVYGSALAIKVHTPKPDASLFVECSAGDTYARSSNASRVDARTDLVGVLPEVLDGYTIATGTTRNPAFFTYDYESKMWTETNCYEPDRTYSDAPRYIYRDLNTDTFKETALEIKQRTAGNDENNPQPKFIDYGITGIGAYQSRLILLSGSYVYFSRTTDFEMYSRTTVTELLDDDAIELAHAGLSAVQFEYALPFNKDLLLFAQDQQAVVPASNSALTPKNAVIYPMTRTDVSLAVEPQVVARSLYYVYQRGTEYYQVGEMYPNSYTDAQYNTQGITSHIPLYAEGVCNAMASSATNNMVVFVSSTKDVLVNQFLWQGDERPVMAFHKWRFCYDVVACSFIDEYLLLFFKTPDNKLLFGSMNTQLNQLDDKPIPYVDFYQYVDVVDGKFKSTPARLDDLNVAVIYDDMRMRHKFVQCDFKAGTTAYKNGRIVVGSRYTSNFVISPPFIKNNDGLTVAGTGKAVIQSVTMTLKGSGTFAVEVADTYGVGYSNPIATPQNWSEANLSSNWVNTVSSLVIPCRAQLASMTASFSTNSTYELNVISSEYNIRYAQKRKFI